MSEPIAILNGRFVSISQATLSVFDSGFVHGAAVGDLMRTFHHRVFDLDAHVDRFFRGIDALGIERRVAPRPADVRKDVLEVVKHNAGLIPADHDLGVVVFATPGANRTYLGAAEYASASRCTWGAHTFPLPFEFWAERVQHGQRLVIPEAKHLPAECLDGRIKWRNRLHWYLADQAARASDAEVSALLLDANGHLTETSGGSFFVVKNGAIRTPKPDNTLDGISRRIVCELAEKLRIPCEFADLTREEALSADECWTASTTYCLMPVAAIDGSAIGGAIPGPVFTRLAEVWNKRAGLNIIHQIVSGAADRLASGRR